MKKELKVGSMGENLVIDCFAKAGIKAIKNENIETRSDYDLICELKSIKFTVEVKVDYKSGETGNLCCEYYNPKSDKPSGINITTADLWVYVLPDDNHMTIWVVTTKSLKQYIESNNPFKIFDVAGDDNASIYLYKLDKILPIFTRLDNISHEQIAKEIKKLLK